jgi:hypothetical protein
MIERDEEYIIGMSQMSPTYTCKCCHTIISMPWFPFLLPHACAEPETLLRGPSPKGPSHALRSASGTDTTWFLGCSASAPQTLSIAGKAT